jgi:hypothetical protein
MKHERSNIHPNRRQLDENKITKEKRTLDFKERTMIE